MQRLSVNVYLELSFLADKPAGMAISNS